MPEQIAIWTAAAVANLFNATSVALGAQIYTATYAATYIASTVALSYGVSALAQDAAQRDNPGQFLDTMVASDAPRQIIVGERETGGSMVGRYVTGPGNNNLIEVIALADHRLEALLQFNANGILQASDLVHGVRTAIAGYRDKDGDRLWVTWYDGRHDQAVDANLSGRLFQNQPDWTGSHRGRGVSYLIVESQWDDDVMLTPISTTVKVRGGRWYDRRLDSTAGGSGTQRHMDPDTWTYTTNNDVFADHYQLGVVPYPNAVKTSGQPLYSWGLGLKTWQLPYDVFKEEADLTDEMVLKKDGITYQRRYALNSIFSGFETHKAILQKVARAKAGRILDRGGRLAMVSPQAKTSVMTLYDQDLVTGEQSKYSPKLSISELYNTFRGTFPDPTSGYRPIEYPKLESAEWLAADGGDELPEDVSVDSDTDEERVQRLVWLHAQDRRRQARLSESYGPWAIEIEAGDWFERVGSKFPTGKLFEAMRVDHMNSRERGMYVTIVAKEVDPADVAWPIDQAADISRPQPPTQETNFAILEPPELIVTPFSVSDGGLTIPAIGVVLNNATDTRIRSALIEIIKDGGGPILQKTIEAGVGVISNGVSFLEGLTPATNYVVRARYQGLITPSEYSTDYGVTTTSEYVVPEASNAAPGSPLEDLLNEANAALNSIANYPLFPTIGALGALEFEANVPGPGGVKVLAGQFEHPVLEETIVTSETVVRTPWGVAYAPANGWFGIVYSDEACNTRFSNGSGGTGHFFVCERRENAWWTYNIDRNDGEEFLPALNDVVVGEAKKPLASGSDYLGSTDGITEIESFVRDQQLRTRVEILEVDVGDPADPANPTGSIYARYAHITQVQADDNQARVDDYTALNAALGTTNAAVIANSSAIATNYSAQAAINSAVTASFGTTNANVTANTTAIATEQAARISADNSFTAAIGVTNANVTSNTTAIATNLAAQATINTSTNASIGSLTASVGTNSSAIVALDGRVSAYYGIKVAAGTNVATIEAMASGGGVPSTVVISAGQIQLNGAVIITSSVGASKLNVASLDAITGTIGLLRTATSGARMELESNQLRAYDSSGTMRVRLGVW